MLNGGVVDDHVHDYFEPSFVAFIQKSVKRLHVPELFIDITVIAYIVAIIVIRRRIKR